MSEEDSPFEPYEFERSDPPVWFEGNGLEYPIQKTLHQWMEEK